MGAKTSFGLVCVAAGALLIGCGSSPGTTGDGSVAGNDGGLPTGSPVRLSLGSLGTCVVYSGGQQWCWGWNQNGQFGTSRDTQFERPEHIYELGAVDRMALAGDFGCVLLATGDVECFGYDHGGTDQPVSLGGAAVGIATGHGHACALMTSGQVLCWGQNMDGQLGDGTLQGRVDPAAVSGLSNVAAIAAAADRSCALDTTGGVWCWGRRLDGSGDDRLSPELMGGLGNTTALSMDSSQTCALLDDQTVSCWGYGACNALDLAGDCATPVTVPGLSAVDEIAVGQSAGCARSGSELRCWGSNTNGQMGDGTLDPLYTPTLVDGLTGVTLVGFGSDHVCVAVAGDDILCWGSNGNGEIGNGTTIDQLTPVDVGL